MMFRPAWCVLAAAAAVTGCSSSAADPAGGPSPFRATMASETGFCQAKAARALRCEYPWDRRAAQSCEDAARCYDRLLRPDVKEAVAACVSPELCGGDIGEDECVRRASLRYAATPAYERYSLLCTALAKTGCRGDRFDDAQCRSGMPLGYNEQTLDFLARCYVKPCAEAVRCQNEVLRSAGCD